MEFTNAESYLRATLERRIMLIDGAMGTSIQARGLSESDFRGARFADHGCALKGNNEVLCLTQPDIIRDIHERYFEAGADIAETNTFGATAVAQAEYRLDQFVYEINRRAAELAKEAAVTWTARTPQKPRLVAGALGPTGRTLSISSDPDDPGYRAITFDQLKDAYALQVRGLVDGGADLLMIETIFDTLNAKAALLAIGEVLKEKGARLPVIVSATISDRSGRMLAGQTPEAFWYSIEHVKPLAVGLNCGLGATEVRPFLQQLSRVATAFVSCYPNAGLPNALGEYTESPQTTAALVRELALEGMVNLVGGCCGTSYAHIEAICAAVTGIAPRKPPLSDGHSHFSGLEPLSLGPDSGFQVIGERTNVAGSRKFLNLIKKEDYRGAVRVALDQVRAGANILDVSMDEAMLDAEHAMTRFLNMLASEPEVMRIPIMLDSSRWSVIEAGLKCLQGKSIVNSISLKDGEAAFVEHAQKLRAYGAAAVVMACDEQGQAETADRKLAICERALGLLTERAGFEVADIIFDPGIFAIATGMEEHREYANAFIEAVRQIKRRFPGVKVSGGISNISFAFRGQDGVREAMHSAFLYHAISAGLDMGIVNAGQIIVYQQIDPELLERVEDALFNRRPDATERLVAAAQKVGAQAKKQPADQAWRSANVEERIAHALVYGVSDFLAADVEEARQKYRSALAVIERPLMGGMKAVGELFGAGKMFLPQVVKSARVMKEAFGYLQPYIEDGAQAPEGSAFSRGRVLLATVKGDVHDIGKNLVGAVLGCNGYQVIDLGVRVAAEKIVETSLKQKVDFIGLSGLITPSLEEMASVAAEMERRQMRIPLLIGGATASLQHTAIKIAPCYQGPTVYVSDASRAVHVVAELSNPGQKEPFCRNNRQDQETARQVYGAAKRLDSYAEANQKRVKIAWRATEVATPEFVGRRVLEGLSLAAITPYLDWTFLFTAWELKGRFPDILDHPRYGSEARKLHQDAEGLLKRIVDSKLLEARAVYGFWHANSDGNDIVVWHDHTRSRELARFPMLRQQLNRETQQPRLCLSDFVAPLESGIGDFIGAFGLTTGIGAQELVRTLKLERGDFEAILAQLLAARLAEALSEFLHERVRREWGYGKTEQLSAQERLAGKYRGIRPAFGYPACPDHTEKARLLNFLEASAIGITLTENFAMLPAASASGIYLSHPQSRYFSLGKIAKDQVQDYARRKSMPISEVERWLAPNLGYER